MIINETKLRDQNHKYKVSGLKLKIDWKSNEQNHQFWNLETEIKIEKNFNN